MTCDFVFGLSKTELYLHLEDTLEPDLKLVFVRRSGVDTGQSTVEKIQTIHRFSDLTPFLAVYYLAMDAPQDKDDLHDLATTYFKRARANGIVRAEYFFGPQVYTSRGIVIETVIHGYHRAAVEAREAGLPADLILCSLRDISVQSALEMLQTVLPYRDMSIGVGLDFDECDSPSMKFVEVSALAREVGLRVMIHCDIDRVGSTDSIRVALIGLSAERLDHGADTVGDSELVAYARDHGIGLTPCPLSNSLVTEEMRGEEIAELIAAGVKVNVNSDDSAYFGGHVGGNYLAFAQRSDPGCAGLERITRNSIEAAWISDDEKAELLEHVDRLISEN